MDTLAIKIAKLIHTSHGTRTWTDASECADAILALIESNKEDELRVAYEYVEQAKERCDIKDAEIERLLVQSSKWEALALERYQEIERLRGFIEARKRKNLLITLFK